MLKSRELFMISSACVFGILLVAINFADRFVTQLPENAKIVPTDLDSEFKLISAAYASVVAPRVGKFDLGRVATKKEVAAWNRDISPDGTGLPVGSGDAIDGEMITAKSPTGKISR